MLSISDTRHINHDTPPKLQFYPDLSNDYSEEENQPFLGDLKGGSEQGSISQRSDAEKQPQATATPQNTENTSEYLQEFAKYSDEAAKLIESNKPTYDQERENRLKRLGRAQKFTDAFSILAQAIGAGAGASVPQMQMNNSQSTSEAIRRMRELHENEEKRYNLMNFQERLRGLQYKQQEAMRGYENERQSAEWKRRSEAEKQNQLEVIQRKHELDNDPTTIDNQLKARKQANDDLEAKARADYYRSGVSSRSAYSDYQRAKTENEGKTTETKKAPYLTLYDSAASAEPAAIIQDEGQAIAVFNAILADQSIKDKDVELLRTLANSGTGFDKDEIKNTVFKYGLQVMKKNPEKSNEVPQFFQKKENVDALGGYFRSVDLSYPQDSIMRDRMKVTYLVKNAGMTEQQAIETLNKIR